MMTTHALRPFLATPDAAWWQRINYAWWLRRVPMFLLALPAAYGVGAFAGAYLPAPFNWVAGGAFEATYIGAIAIADQQTEDGDWVTTLLWWLVNLAAVAASILSNLLWFSGGAYARITAEIATHAVPLPVLGFFYGLLLHRVTAAEARRVAMIEDAERERQAIEARRVTCPYCGEQCASKEAMYGHWGRSCAQHPKRRAA